MGYALPWNVRGIDPDIKELAVEAAHRAGMPVGQWLSHVLADTIPDFLDEDEGDYAPARGGRSRKSRRLEEMNYRLERVLRPRAQLSARRHRDEDADEAPVYQLLETALRAMERGEGRKEPSMRDLSGLHTARQRDLEPKGLDQSLHKPAQEAPAAPVAASVPAPVDNTNEALLKAIQSLEAQVTALKQESAKPSLTEITPPAALEDACSPPAEATHPLPAAAMPAAAMPIAAMTAATMPANFATDIDFQTPSGTRPFTKNDPAIRSAIEEIEARRRALDNPHTSKTTATFRAATPAAQPLEHNHAKPTHSPDPFMDDLRSRLDTIVSRMDAIHAKPNLESEALQAKLDQITARMDEVKNKPVEVINPIQAKLDAIVARLDAVDHAPRPEDMAIQTKLDQITARLDAAQTLARPEAAQLQAQLEAISRRMEDSRAPSAETKSLQSRLEDIASRIEEVRKSSKEPSRLQERVEHIAGRIDQWKAPSTDDLTQIRRDIANLSGTLEALSPQRLVGVVENAVAQIAEKSFHAQQQNMPERLIEPLEQIQYDIREVLREVGSSRISDRLTHEVSIIARKLDQIGHGTTDIGRLEDILREMNVIKSLVGQALRTQPLDGLALQIEALGHQLDQYRVNPHGMQDQQILDTINDIRDRMERIDPQATFSGMEARLKVIADIEARLGSITGIEEKLGEIARNVTKLTKEKRGPAVAAETFPQLETITEKLAQIDKAIDSARVAPSPELDAIVRKLDEIGSSIDRAAASPANNTPSVSPDTLPQLETITEKLEQIDKALGSARVAPSLELGAIVRKLDEIGSSIDRAAAHPASNTPSVSPETLEKQQALAHLLERLSAKMEQADAPNSGSGALDALQDEIARLTQRIEMGAGNTMPGLDEMSRSISNLCNDIESAKKDMLAAAETAAEKAAREAIRNFARDESTDTLAAEGLLLMRRDLGEFKSAQTESEQRTQKTLEALQSTLQGLVGRLSQMESSAPGASMQKGIAQAASAAPATLAASTPQAYGHSAPPNPASSPKAGATAKAQKGVQAVDFNDMPLEPGLEPDRLAAMPDSPPTADPRSNFIAAARRAAQSAATQNQAMLDEVAETKVTEPSNARAKRSKTPVPSGALLTRARKPILLGLAALVFAAGAISLMSTRSSTPEIDGTIALPELPAPSGKTGAKPGEAANPASGGSRSGTSAPAAPAAQPPVRLGKAESRLDGTPSKLEARLPDGIVQADPLTVGSIPAPERVQDTLPANLALAELVNQSSLKAPDRLRDAAMAANPAALFELGSRFADGRGGQAKDPQLAMRWFEQAANMGHAPSQYRLAGLYREGKGVTKDPAAAFQWFDRAATQGNILAMHNAAVLLAEGVHGTPDYAGAALWFKRAAEHGVKDSQFNVAILFARGLGVNQDLVESYRWFSAAAAQGDPDAAKKREDIAARLTKDQLAKEKEWLKSFTPLKPVAAANEPGIWDAEGARTAAATPPAPAPKNQRAK